MKKDIMKKSLLILLALILACAALTGCGGQTPAPSESAAEESSAEPSDEPASEPAQDVPQEQPTEMKLLGFESYEEFTGSKVLIGNMLGRIEVNTDPQYITEGSASIMFRPQGDYTQPAKHPFFKIDFLNTTAATRDFSAFKSVSFDAYNATDRELHIRACLSVGKDDGAYTTAIKSVYTLAPNAWTTCTYDVSEMAGFEFYDLETMRYMTFEFLEHKTSKEDTPATIYIDNLVGNYFKEGESAVPVSFSFWDGVTFENSYEKFLLFANDYSVNKTELSRAHYTDENISLIPSVGAYGMRVDATGSIWPTFSVKLGEKVPKDTVLSFKAYVKVRNAGTDTFMMESYDETTGGRIANPVELTDNACNEWIDVSIRLGKETDTVTAFFNFDDFSGSSVVRSKFSGKEVVIYLDNMKLSEWQDPASLTPSDPDFASGIGFEKNGEQYLFENSNTAIATAVKLSRVRYSDEGIKSPDNGGSYALRGIVRGAAYPEIKVDYKRTLPAGTVLTFMAYVDPVDYANSNYKVESFGNVNITDMVPTGQWVPIKIRLSSAQSSSRFFFNFDNGSDKTKFGPGKVLVYLDMVRVEEPVPASGDILSGYGFEDAGNASYWTGQGRKGAETQDGMVERLTYAKAGLTAPEGCGEHVLKISHETFIYPKFRINFGQTLPAGTKISFKAYGTINGSYERSTNLFQFTSANGGGGNEATKQFPLNEWTDLSLTLEKAGTYVDLFWDYSRSGCADPTPGAVYIDNVKADLPVTPEGDFLEGVGFEIPGNAELFTGQKREGMASQDAAIARVKYEDTGISAPSGGGSYALKISHDSFIYPKFRINFGEYLPAGTVFSFMAYGTVDGDYSTSQNLFQFTSPNGGGGNEATRVFGLNEWTKVSFTLENGGRYVDLFWDYSRSGCADPTPGAVYIDKVVAKLPPEPVTLDITQGTGFEQEGEIAYITRRSYTEDTESGSKGENIPGTVDTIEWVSYDEEEVSAPDEGGSHAVRLVAGNKDYPSFRINFGKTLPAGTIISFDANVAFTGSDKGVQFELSKENSAGGSNGNVGPYFYQNTWTRISFATKSEADHVDLYFSSGEGNQKAVAYIDNLSSAEPVIPDPVKLDITLGTSFENEDEIGYISQRTHTETGDLIYGTVDAVERVTYADEQIPAAEENVSGDWMIRLMKTDFGWPSFRINFGKTLPAGTAISFKVYGVVTGGDGNSIMAYSRVNEAAGNQGEIGTHFAQKTWTQINFKTLAEDDHVDLYFDAGDGAQKCLIYIDDLAGGDAAESLDITKGVDFEQSFHSGYLVPDGGSVTAITGYEAESLTVDAEKYGANAMKLSGENAWPNFRINFGKELAAGTAVSFDAYGVVDSIAEGKELAAYDALVFEFKDGAVKGNETPQFGYETWTHFTVILAKNAEYIDGFFNLDRANGASGHVYIDNLIAVEPVELDITKGVTFENASDAAYFTPSGSATAEVIGYEAESLTVDAEKYGAGALKLSGSNAWPAFTLNFGKELAAGTTISFDAYGVVSTLAEGKELAANDALVFEFKNGAVTGGETAQFGYEKWTALTVTLAKNAASIDGFFNLDRANGATGYVYIDNITVSEPAPFVLDITQGADFESPDHAGYIGQRDVSSVAVDSIGIVKYADAGVSAPDDGGEYAVEIKDSSAKAHFRINFGKKLTEDTVISFKAFGIKANARAKKVTFYFAVDGDESGNNGVAASFAPGSWNEVSFKLGDVTGFSTDSEYIDLYFDNGSTKAESRLYIDNLTAK